MTDPNKADTGGATPTGDTGTGTDQGKQEPASAGQGAADPQPGQAAGTDPAAVASGGSQGDDGFKSEESKKAVLADLAKEREARKALETKFSKLGEALGVEKPENGKTDVEQLTERLSKHETDLATERQARWRAEVANTKQLTAEQTEFLTGSTREEIEASADKLLAAFPAQANGSGTPKPDPSQGSRSGAPDLDSRIAEAQKNGDWRTVMQLQNQKFAAQATQRT